LPLYKGHRVTESVLIGIFRVVNKPKAEVHPGHKLTGPGGGGGGGGDLRERDHVVDV